MAATTEDLHEALGQGRTMEADIEVITGRSLTIVRNILHRAWHQQRKCPHWSRKLSRRRCRAEVSVVAEEAPGVVVVDCEETAICRK